MAKRSVVAVMGLALALSACAGSRDHKGFVLDPTLADAIQVGIDNKESVTKTIGRPTFTGQFDPNEWYYVSRNTATLAFRDPKVTEQTVLRIRFDQAGNVASVEKTGKETIVTRDCGVKHWREPFSRTSRSPPSTPSTPLRLATMRSPSNAISHHEDG